MFQSLAIPGVFLYHPRLHSDTRGYFAETWSDRAFAGQGLPGFIQDNEALSVAQGTVRGLHFQTEPFAQAKLLRCVSGAVFDVVVDIRQGSPAYGRHIAIELRLESGAIFIPAGCAHGYCTLAPNTLVQYKVGAPYSPQHEGGIVWNDPDLAIPWPVEASLAILSDRDRGLPRLADVQAPFVFAPG